MNRIATGCGVAGAADAGRRSLRGDPGPHGAALVFDKIRRRFPWLELIWADGGVAKGAAGAYRDRQAERRGEGLRRATRLWVVERNFSWFRRNRRLSKDFENHAETLATFVTLVSIQSGPLAACQGAGRKLSKPQLGMHDDRGPQTSSGFRWRGERPLCGSVNGLSPERTATTGTRRQRPFAKPRWNREVRPHAVIDVAVALGYGT